MPHGKGGVHYPFAQRSTPGLNFHVNFCAVGEREFDSTEEYMQHKQTYRQKIQISSSLINGCDTRFVINLCFLATLLIGREKSITWRSLIQMYT